MWEYERWLIDVLSSNFREYWMRKAESRVAWRVTWTSTTVPGTVQSTPRKHALLLNSQSWQFSRDSVTTPFLGAGLRAVVRVVDSRSGRVCCGKTGKRIMARYKSEWRWSDHAFMLPLPWYFIKWMTYESNTVCGMNSKNDYCACPITAWLQMYISTVFTVLKQGVILWFPFNSVRRGRKRTGEQW